MNVHEGGVYAATVTTTNATPWNPNAAGTVYSLALSGTTMYAGGSFTSIGGAARSFAAALDTAVETNNALAWNPAPNSSVYSIIPSGTVVYLAGNFTSIDGRSRAYLAAVNASTGAVNDWDVRANGTVYAIALSGSTLYAGGMFNMIGGAPRTYIAALDTITGDATPWNPESNGPVTSLALSEGGGALYVGGYFGGGAIIVSSPAINALPAPSEPRAATLGGMSRLGLAALDTVTGKATAWNPVAYGTPSALFVAGRILYTGGSFISMNNKPYSGFSAFQFPANAAPSAALLVSPADGQTGVGTTATLSWKKASDADNDSLTYHVFVCTDQNANACNPVQVASRGPAVYLAGMGCSAMLFLVGMAGSEAGVRRKKIILLLIGVLLIAGFSMISCSSGGGGGGTSDEMSSTVSGLAPGTTYFWKVSASDGNGGSASSAVRSFTTQ